MPKKRVKKTSGVSDNSVTDYLNQIGEIPVLSDDAELALLELAVQRDLPAVQELVRSNLRLVAKEAARYSRRSGMELMDLIHEGNCGLYNAIAKYDVSYGTKFSTYAIWWIRQALNRAVANQSRTVRVPVHVHSWISKVLSTRSKMSTVMGRSPTPFEVAEKLDSSAEEVETALRLSQQMGSLASPAGGQQEKALGDVLSADRANEPEHASRINFLRSSIEDAMEDMDEKEQEVLEHRFGLHGRMECTLEQLGAKMGVTRERVRQIEAKAIARLRHPSRSRFLVEFYHE